MSAIEVALRFLDHVTNSDRWHGQHCLFCQIAKGSTKPAKHSHPVSRDLAVGPGRWTKRFVCPPGPLKELLLTLRYMETTLDEVHKNSTADDLVWIVSDEPVTTKDLQELHTEAQVTQVLLKPQRPPRKGTHPNVHGYVGYYTHGIDGETCDFQACVADAFGEYKRRNWVEFDKFLRKAVTQWEAYARYDGPDPVKLVYVGF